MGTSDAQHANDSNHAPAESLDYLTDLVDRQARAFYVALGLGKWLDPPRDLPATRRGPKP